MTITNPVLYIDKDNIVKVLTVEIPKEPNICYGHVGPCDGITSINCPCSDYETSLQRAKDSAVPIKNYNEIISAIQVQGFLEWKKDFVVKSDTFCTLKGKYELTFVTSNWIHPEEQLATLTEVKEDEIKIGDTFYVEGHERSHRCVGYAGEDMDIIAENNLPYIRSKCSKTPFTSNDPVESYKSALKAEIERVHSSRYWIGTIELLELIDKIK